MQQIVVAIQKRERKISYIIQDRRRRRTSRGKKVYMVLIIMINIMIITKHQKSYFFLQGLFFLFLGKLLMEADETTT
jgi:hypothetical protein